MFSTTTLPILGIDRELSGISEVIICENMMIDNKVVTSVVCRIK
jgi:hypothetical protein